jgi:tetratricopeptide (TPR) repeat protein
LHADPLDREVGALPIAAQKDVHYSWRMAALLFITKASYLESMNLSPKSQRRSPPKSGSKSDLETITGRIFSFRARLLCAGIVFLVALVLYTWTLAPTVTLTDSGELIVVARDLGVAHPPGVPLWIVLAHLASLMPLGNVAVRINFSSALFAALACATLTLAVAELMITSSFLAALKRRKRGAREIEKAKESSLARLLIGAPALGAGLLMAFSRTLWSYATIAEVYALNAFLILMIFGLMLRWRRDIVADRVYARTIAGGQVAAPIASHDAFLYAAALVFGLALGVHHVTVALILPALGLLVYRTEGWRFFTSRRLIYAALISIGALIIVYTYLPIAASHSPLVNWGKPRSLQEIWWHVTGRQYQVYFSFTPKLVGQQFAEFCRMALREFGVPWLPLPLLLAFAGFVNAFKRDRTSFWFLLFIIIADLAYAVSYEIAEDKDAYYLPAFISIAIAVGLGIHWLIQSGASKPMSMRRPFLVAATAVLLVCVIALTGNLPFNNRRRYFIAHDYLENLLSTIKPNGLLLTLDWQVASPMFYAQEIEHRRRDVEVVDINLLRRSWYFDYLSRAYPGLVERSRKQIDVFVENLKEWERDPDAFKANLALTQKISAAFLSMIQSIVANESKVASVYMTSDLLFTDSMNGELTRWITQNYQLVPEGLVFNLTHDRSLHDLPDLHLETRGLADGTMRFEKADVVNVKVLPAYTRMLINRGRYLESFNEHERAVAAFKQALALDPSLSTAKQGLAESAAKLRNQ